MKKKKNNRKKALTAMGAVVAAGLTPGFIAVSASGAPLLAPNAEITAAEVVAIDGDSYSFEELYAMQQSQRQKSRSQPQQQAVRYGVPPSQRPVNPEATYYGVRYPVTPYVVEQSPSVDREEIQKSILTYLMDYCAILIDADARGIIITPDSDLTKDLGMTEDDLKDLKAEIEEYFGVEVSHHRFRLKGQLNTLLLVSEYITKLKTIWD